MISTILSAAIGTVINRVRGGLLNEWISGKGWSAFIGGKMINDMVFALWFTVLLGLSYQGGVGSEAKYDSDFNLYAMLALFAAMWLGRAPGWGDYIGNMIRKQDNGGKEIEQIDELVRSDDPDDKPVLRNTVALSLRGVMWTVPLAAGFLIAKFVAFPAISVASLIPLILVGLLMGPVYLIAIEVSEKLLKRGRDMGWPYGEYFWGAVLWGAVACII